MRLGTFIVFSSIAINVAIVVCARFATDTTAYFKQAFPYFVLVAIVGGVGAVLDWRKTKRLARSQFFREKDAERSEYRGQ
ncbi:hypothetical protein O4H66_28365 [Comamonadaceae bacterium G21597-S1]|nr:hypothetical protein [Comamonadaceae bacterium G21597-S1]